MSGARVGELLRELYQKLWDAFGPQGWWPGETPFEVILGAILTQNTNWNNVAQVIAGLKEEGLLDPRALREMPDAELAGRLKPSGYFNIKARRVKNFLDFFAHRFHDSLGEMAQEDLGSLRAALLTVKGIGPETADSILLYALHKPTFVVDAYTYRVLSRHHLAPEACSYEELQGLFMGNLPADVPLYQEFHALLVRLGKEFCRPRPQCPSCPLHEWRISGE
ncbi:MAG: endonuclease III domain-containing protein [Deltaproteobacteria bacterium]|nr:endonuclease III domain-containing protein [Deltaproteobacteria bacterium]